MSKIMRELYAEARRAQAVPEGKRYSVDYNDPGYRNLQLAGGAVLVYLDGVRVDRCVTADEVQGYVEFYPEKWTVGSPVERAHGVVRVEPA